MHELLSLARAGLLHAAVDSLLHYLSHSAVSLAIVGTAAWLGDRMLRRVGPQAQHRMWVAALLTGVALPLVPAGALVSWFGQADASGAVGTATVTYHAIAAAAGRWTLPPLLRTIAAMAYLLTVMLSMAQLLWRWRGAWAMVRRADAVPTHAAARGLLEDAARRFEVPIPEMRCSTETRGPVVLGLRRAVLLVPESFFKTEKDEDIQTQDDRDVRIQSDGDARIQSDGDIAAALAHECAHIARWDFTKNLLYEFVAAAAAYHPACRMMRRRIAETRELVCDEMAAGAVGDRPEYAASLLRLATAMAAPAAQRFFASGTQAIGVFDAGILEERVMRLTMDVPKVSRIERIAMVTLVASTLACGALGATAMAFDVSPQTKETVYKVGPGVSPPVLSYSVDAAFPPSQRKRKWDGVSIVGLIVNSNGMPEDPHIEPLTASMSKMLSKVHPNKEFHLSPDFDKNAMEAVRQYRFHPALRDGKPVAVAITIAVNFHNN